MTSRVYKVCPEKKKFRIQVRTAYAKASKRTLYERRGYPCLNSANNDVKRLISFFESGRTRITDFQSCYTDVSNCRNLASKADYAQVVESVRGIARKKKQKHDRKGYNSYKKIMISWKEPYLSEVEWFKQLGNAGFNKERFMRRFYRDSKVMHSSIAAGLLSKNDVDIVDSLKSSELHFSSRICILRNQLLDHKTSLKILRAAIFSGKTFTLLLKAKFDDEDDVKDVIDLSADDEFTLTNISKSQLSRSIQQCQLVEKLYRHLSVKVGMELALLEEVTATVTSPSFDILTSTEVVQSHWKRLKEFKIKNSMGTLATMVSDETDGIISNKTILKWYHEFKKFKMFKEDMRGCHLRRFVLEEYGLKRPFELFLKNERHLTVDVARIQLEALIHSHVSKHPDDSRDLVELMLPLHNRTVHRWMLTCGCKYEKATVSYYTDSHEAEATKRDFKER